jgi:hypothetical protein
MNEYTVEITPSAGQSYFLRFTAPDIETVNRILSDHAMRSFIGDGATSRIVFTLPWL